MVMMRIGISAINLVIVQRLKVLFHSFDVFHLRYKIRN